MATIAEALALAVQHQRAGNLPQAEQICRDVLGAHPANGDALHLQGLLAHQAGRHEEAAAVIRRALACDPGRAAWHGNLGVVYQALGRLGEAESCYREALRLQPDSGVGHYNLGNTLKDQGRLDEAAACYREALRLRPTYPEAYNNLGSTARRLGLPDEAAACHLQALRLRPESVSALNNLGLAYQDLGRLEEAIRCFQEALRQPGWAEAGNNLGNALREAGRLQEAEACLREVVRLQPASFDAHGNLGVTLQERGRLPEAEATFAEALRLRPDYPEAHFNLALVRLLQGDFAGGWPDYEWRWRCKDRAARAFRQPRWDGAASAGRVILLHAEQGLGDTLQFVRYAALVQGSGVRGQGTGVKGVRVIVECPQPLVRLLASCPGVDQVVAQGSPLPAFDVQAPLLSLPGILGTTLETIPAQVPYLSADPALVERWRRELGGGGFKVGIAWQGNPKNKGDRRRSVPLACFAPLAAVDGVRLYSLQVGPGREQLPGAAFPVTDLGSRLGDFADTAAVMMNLDLVVTVDTALAHCAGALGLPAWVALPQIPDWRWLLGRADSPWYPTLRLFRQATPGDWQGVFRRLAESLAR